MFNNRSGFRRIIRYNCSVRQNSCVSNIAFGRKSFREIGRQDKALHANVHCIPLLRLAISMQEKTCMQKYRNIPNLKDNFILAIESISFSGGCICF